MLGPAAQNNLCMPVMLRKRIAFTPEARREVLRVWTRDGRTVGTAAVQAVTDAIAPLSGCSGI